VGPPAREGVGGALLAMEPDHYAVLGVQPDAGHEDVKRAFHRAALRLHPDKTVAPAGGGPSGTEHQPAGASAAAKYLLVQEAWGVLGDAAARGAYDRRCALRALREDVHINESVALGEMDAAHDVQGSGQAGFTWPCRCGGSYALLEEDAARFGRGGEVAVPCASCSLHIRVLLPGGRGGEA